MLAAKMALKLHNFQSHYAQVPDLVLPCTALMATGCLAAVTRLGFRV